MLKWCPGFTPTISSNGGSSRVDRTPSSHVALDRAGLYITIRQVNKLLSKLLFDWKLVYWLNIFHEKCFPCKISLFVEKLMPKTWDIFGLGPKTKLLAENQSISIQQCCHICTQVIVVIHVHILRQGPRSPAGLHLYDALQPGDCHGAPLPLTKCGDSGVS